MAAVTPSALIGGEPDEPPETAFLHGSAVLVGETGLFIRGPSGAGKSGLCLSLIEEAGRRGLFARMVADDRVAMVARSGRLIARPHAAIAGQVECRGQGILAVPHEPAVVIRLVVDLVQRDKTPRFPTEPDRTTVLHQLSCPRFCLAQESSPVDNAHAVLVFLRRWSDGRA